ncbi:hypothetical protein MLC52_10880 [Sulfurimonas sp. NW15]|uniref:hypothetical protein n=1 Tax=Sulfurimonas sp. NW15 TaxID=2922729 RepID=UPI003DA84801
MVTVNVNEEYTSIEITDMEVVVDMLNTLEIMYVESEEDFYESVSLFEDLVGMNYYTFLSLIMDKKDFEKLIKSRGGK